MAYSKEDLPVLGCILLVLSIWWSTYILFGWTPTNEWGNGMFYAKWLADRRFFLIDKLVPYWNQNVGLGVNYIGEDPMFNPLSLGNIFFYFFSNPKHEWLFSIFFWLILFGLGTYKFLRSLGISHYSALLASTLIVLYPRWTDDVYYGAGRMVTGYGVLPWVLLVIHKMFITKPQFNDYMTLGILGGAIFIGGGSYNCINFSYLIIPWFISCLFAHAYNNRNIDSRALLMAMGGAAFSLLLAFGLSSFLLLPLLDNMLHTTRSAYGFPAGYGSELISIILPWNPNLFTTGFYGQRLYLPDALQQSFSVQFYFGILALPSLVLVISEKSLRDRLRFFWIWPLVLVFLYSKLGNFIFPVTKYLEHLLGGTSSESYVTFGYIICITAILAGAFDYLRINNPSCSTESFTLRRSTVLTKRVCLGISILYVLVSSLWVLFWFLAHYLQSLVHCFDSLGLGPLPYLRYPATLQFMAYAYFFDNIFFIAMLTTFILRIISLRFFVSALTRPNTFKPIAFIVLLCLDFLIITAFLIYPFTPANLVRFGQTIPQNVAAVDVLGATSRVGANHFSQKLKHKMKILNSTILNTFALNPRWDPVRAAEILRDSNIADLGYYEPIFDPAVSYYPTTIGKSSYSSHLSIAPEYFWDFDAAMNAQAPGYSRGSWVGVWDPSSPLVDIAGIDYLFWYEPLHDKRYEMVQHSPVGDIYLYHNTKAVSKAYLVNTVINVPDRKSAIERLKERNFDPNQSAVIEDYPTNTVYLATQNRLNSSAGTVDINTYNANLIKMTVHANSKSLLVIDDLYERYWSARVDGLAADIFRVNVAFRGVMVDAGEHDVILVYDNPAFTMGRRISLATLLAIAALYTALWVRKFRIA